MMLKLFGKKSKSGNSSESSSPSEPPNYDQDPSGRYQCVYPHQLTCRILDVNQELEQVEPDKKKGKLPAYETERDHHLRKLMDNYGAGGGMGGFGGSPKLPNIPPRVKKPKKEKPPKYPA